LTPASAKDSFLKVGNYDVIEDKTQPPQKKINATSTRPVQPHTINLNMHTGIYNIVNVHIILFIWERKF